MLRLSDLDITDISAECLLRLYETADQQLEQAKRTAGLIEQEIFRRADEQGATGIPSDVYECSIKVTNTYDPSLLVPLKEVFTDSELKACYVPAHQETIDVAEKWNATQAWKAARKHGDKALALLERAKTPRGRKLEFRRK